MQSQRDAALSISSDRPHRTERASLSTAVDTLPFLFRFYLICPHLASISKHPAASKRVSYTSRSCATRSTNLSSVPSIHNWPSCHYHHHHHDEEDNATTTGMIHPALPQPNTAQFLEPLTRRIHERLPTETKKVSHNSSSLDLR